MGYPYSERTQKLGKNQSGSDHGKKAVEEGQQVNKQVVPAGMKIIAEDLNQHYQRHAQRIDQEKLFCDHIHMGTLVCKENRSKRTGKDSRNHCHDCGKNHTLGQCGLHYRPQTVPVFLSDQNTGHHSDNGTHSDAESNLQTGDHSECALCGKTVAACIFEKDYVQD